MELNQSEYVQVSEINQFVYCPRRHYYIRFFDTIGVNYELTDGVVSHENKSRRGGWSEELYLESEKYRMHGKVDIVDENGTLTPIERKRSESGSYFESDELQLAAYCMLLEESVPGRVNIGYIYTESNRKRHRVRVEDWHRKQVEQIVDLILNMSVDDPPPLTDNPNKCPKCSTREYCMPEETVILEPDKAGGTGWEDRA